MLDVCFKDHIQILKYKINHSLSKLTTSNWWEKDPLYTADQKKDIAFCYETLHNVSRSFSKTIADLPPVLSLDFMVCYLVLRALDTVEDDVDAFNKDIQKRCVCIENFYKTFTCYHDIGENKYKSLMKNYDRVGRVFNLLPSESQKLIKTICKDMGKGMVKYVKKNYTIDTIKQYNEYCHIVAGNVGTVFTKLVVVHGYESSELLDYCKTEKSELHSFGGYEKSVGLFLQKTKCIRDYYKNIPESTCWWPKEIWKKHKNSITDMGYDTASRACLNELVLDALILIPDIIKFHCHLKSFTFRRWISVPSLMAIATLDACFDNPQVFKKNVKISKDDAIRVFLKCDTLETFLEEFSCYLKNIKNKIPLNDPNYINIRDACDKGIACCIQHSKTKEKEAQHCCFIHCLLHFISKCGWVLLISLIISSMLSTFIFSLKSSIVEELRSNAMHGAWVGASQAVISATSNTEQPIKTKMKKKKKKKI